jgi:hypothetical protein
MAYDGNWKTSNADADAIVKKWFKVGMGRAPSADELAKWSKAVRVDGSNTAYKDFSGQISQGYAGDERANAAKKIAESGWNGYELNKGQGQLAGTAGRTGAAGFIDRNREDAAKVAQYASPFISMLLPGAGSGIMGLLNAALAGGGANALSAGLQHGTNIGDIGKSFGTGAAMGAGGKLAGNLLGTGKFLGNQTPTVTAPDMSSGSDALPAASGALAKAPTGDPMAGVTAPINIPASGESYSNLTGPARPSASFAPSSSPIGTSMQPLSKSFGFSNSTSPASSAFGNSSTDLSRQLIGDLNPMKSSPAGGGFWSDLGQAVKKPEVIGGFLKGMSGMRQSDAEAKYANARTASLEQQTRLQQEQYDAQQARAKALQPLLDAMMGKMSGAMGQQTSVAPNPYAR